MFKPLSISLYLFFLVSSPTTSGEKNEHSAVLGDLRVTLTAVRDASGQEVEPYKPQQKLGHHYVLVFFKVKNVASYSSCESYFEYWLSVREGYQYKGVSVSGKNAMENMDLLPGEGTE